jgi:hypothetical protein
MPRGAVASVLANDGKKKTTLRDIENVPTKTTILFLAVSGCHRFVTSLSFVGTGGFSLGIRDTLAFETMQTHSLESENLALKSTLEVAGCKCVFSTNNHLLFESLKRWRTHEDSETVIDFEMRIQVDPRLMREAGALPQFRGLQQFVFAVFHSREMFLFDLFQRTVTAAVSEETAADREFWNSVLIPIALGVLGPMMGVAPLHCACLGCNGMGMLVAGISGAGKSTLAVALAKEGFALVSDDWTYVRREKGNLSAYGLHVPVKLMPECSRFFEELTALRLKLSLNGELAFEVDAAETLGVNVAQRCVPNCVVFLERCGKEESSFEPLARESARRYFTRSAEVLPPQLAAAAAEREAIIEQVTNRDCWLFRYGGTPQQGARALRRFYEEIYDVDRLCTVRS